VHRRSRLYSRRPLSLPRRTNFSTAVLLDWMSTVWPPLGRRSSVVEVEASPGYASRCCVTSTVVLPSAPSVVGDSAPPSSRRQATVSKACRRVPCRPTTVELPLSGRRGSVVTHSVTPAVSLAVVLVVTVHRVPTVTFSSLVVALSGLPTARPLPRHRHQAAVCAGPYCTVPEL